MPPESDDAALDLSVVIPAYNSARWIPSTVFALADAVRAAGVRAELIVVDDGSTDGTADQAEAARDGFPGPVRVLRQTNAGRFLAREAGLRAARAESVLLLDSRVLLTPDALGFITRARAADPTLTVWNAHIVTPPGTPLVGLFWDVPTYVFWRDYLRSPRPFDVTAENFDRAPKGTTAFYAPAALLAEAFDAARPTGDTSLVSDDTKVLRHIAARHPLRLDPGFTAIYRPRTTVDSFVRHTLDRGTLFVDSYAGTSPIRSTMLLLLAILPVATVAVLVWLLTAGHYVALGIIVLIGVLLCLSPAAAAAVNRCPPRSIAAYLLYLPVFCVPFWLGLVRGIVLHRHSFRPTRTPGGVPR